MRLRIELNILIEQYMKEFELTANSNLGMEFASAIYVVTYTICNLRNK